MSNICYAESSVEEIVLINGDAYCQSLSPGLRFFIIITRFYCTSHLLFVLLEFIRGIERCRTQADASKQVSSPATSNRLFCGLSDAKESSVQLVGEILAGGKFHIT